MNALSLHLNGAVFQFTLSGLVVPKARLTPKVEDRFRPTKLPKWGATEYQLPNNTSAFLVELPQSIANHLN